VKLVLLIVLQEQFVMQILEFAQLALLDSGEINV
jgi:hypothetical protein